MIELAGMSVEEMAAIWRDKKQIAIESPKAVAQFERLEGVDFSAPKEVPPSMAALSAEVMAHIAFQGVKTSDTKYTALVAFAYASGGKLLYTKLPSGDYQALVTWWVGSWFVCGGSRGPLMRR
jgi:hypothetical protein